MTDNFNDVGDFHARFALPRVDRYGFGSGPREWDPDLIGFRQRFLQEELDEFTVGFAEKNHAKMFDALIDLVYVAMGTAHLMGYPWQAGWELVQAANMAKVRAAKDGSDSARNSPWDVVKPPSWEPPDVAGLLKKHGFES